MRISDWSSDVCSSDLSPRCHWLISVAPAAGNPCVCTWSVPPSIVNSFCQLACSTLVSLPAPPRSKLVRSVTSIPPVLTSPWLKKQFGLSTIAFPPAGPWLSERGVEGDRSARGEGG